MREKIIVGVSGGVDSSVAALLLKQQGYQVEALFMKNWDERNDAGRCLWEADVEDAMLVCDKLDIPLNTVDLSHEYWDSVFMDFLAKYRQGRTPNPDVLCNQEVKFKAFLKHAVALGADKIATGHYAQIKTRSGRQQLCKAIDSNKDQSYFLCRLNQQQLAQTLFPLGALCKPQVRTLARQAGLITKDKKDSTGICFIGERPFREFLSRYIPMQKGEIRTLAGRLVGEHDGVFFYTLGQRRGLGIGGVRDAAQAPWYVVGKDTTNNILLVAQGHNHPALFSSSLTATKVNWISEKPATLPYACMAKIRYRQADQNCIIEAADKDTAIIGFQQPQRATTPGQYIVFYQAGTCLGGGIIDKSW